MSRYGDTDRQTRTDFGGSAISDYLVANKNSSERIRIIIDVEDYREPGE